MKAATNLWTREGKRKAGKSVPKQAVAERAGT